jgi:hypothetical protein
MKVALHCTVAVLLLASSGSGGRIASASEGEGLTAVGLWSGTVYYGDPANPDTPKEQFLATVGDDGTYGVDSTAATGTHPLNPGDKTEERGVWARQDHRVMTHGFWFDEVGAGAGFSVGRGVSHLEFAGHDRLEGFADFDFLPCPRGPIGCPDPAGVGALVLGQGLGPFPVALRRLR